MIQFFSPLEQFEIIPLISIYLNVLDFSITNEVVILSLIFFFVYSLFIFSTKTETSSFYIIPHRWQIVVEGMFKLILAMIVDNIASKKGQYFFPFVFSLFCYILMLNLIGLVPYSFSLTSHLIVTFALALFMFIGINIICVRIHGLEFFSLFLPGGTSFVLALLLVPIELISFIFKPISLSIRLFANMMAGHTLLKVIAGFAWSLSGTTGILFLLHYIPMLILIPLFGLELGVALIQAFVFSILTCIYLNDSINLH
jgi:ATP synthase subunit 6